MSDAGLQFLSCLKQACLGVEVFSIPCVSLFLDFAITHGSDRWHAHDVRGLENRVAISCTHSFGFMLAFGRVSL